jgi:hypothetical protein
MMAICPAPNDATSFYRGIGPLSRLQKDCGDVSIVFVSHVEYSTLAPVDVVFMQRPFQPHHLQAALMANHHNVPLWLDFDDDLFSVTPDNPTFHMYGDDAVKKRVAKMIGMASVVTVSTPFLGEQLRPMNPNVVVVPNAVDDYQFENRRVRHTPRPKVVFWRGGATHQRDLMTVADQLVAASHDPTRADWTFHFQGYNPWWITEKMRDSHTRHAGSLEPVQYMRLLEELCPALMVVPLVDNVFNRSKSNCSWIEGAYAGAAVIAPDMAEFRRPGVINYDSQEAFGRALRDAMTGRLDLKRIADEGWAEVRRSATLSVVNVIRERVLTQLISRPRGFAA